MTQYINKAAVVAEIERELDSIELVQMGNDDVSCCEKGREDVCKNVLSFLDTLEVKEVDLEEEIDAIWNPRFSIGWDEKSLLSMNHEGFTNIARHFFELGLKTQKGE